ncbi:MAG TPA: electron transfer flavoprotein subunit beta/FixA family protein [Syntrophobacteraceae bacterium]|nr:electron transfer flavoprotein subunit beta/FixA family protein [Syntrophobacteraceae bacterium]
MHIVCCIKQVPDTAEVKIDPDTNTLVRTGVESISNPYDIVAVEAALRIRERYGGRVTALSMGPPQAESSLREALAMGVDDGILLSDRAFAGSDTLATSYTLGCAVRRLSLDDPVTLVLCGKQAIDGDTAQTGPGIATRLGFTQFTYVTEVDWVDLENGRIQVKRKLEDGLEVIRGPLPALLTVELELAKPRRASLPALVRSLRAPVANWDAKAISASPKELGLKGSPTWVRRISSPPAKTGGPLFYAGEDLRESVAQTLDILFSDKTFAAKFMNRWEA